MQHKCMHLPYAGWGGWLAQTSDFDEENYFALCFPVQGGYRSQRSTETADIFRAILIHVADALINRKKIIRFHLVCVVLAMLLLNNSFRMWHAIHIAYRLNGMAPCATQATFDCEK